jgi:ABC-type transporter Mla MlaB component
LDLSLGTQDVPIIKILDRADEFRIRIIGRLEGESVADVSQAWHDAMSATAPRKCVVDISGLSGYDTAGLKLLRRMHHHGTQIAAATPLSLVYLNEISMPRRRGPAVVMEQPRKREPSPALLRLRAAGE